MSTELTPGEAYQMALDTGRKFEEQWRVYKKEEAKLLADNEFEEEGDGTGRDNKEG